MSTVVGQVRQVWRYPVKSLLGESLVTPVPVDGSGLQGDRAYALIAESGAVASAKRPVLWARLLEVSAATRVDGTVVADFGSGEQMEVEDPRFAAAVSDLVGRHVVLSKVGQPNDSLERADPDSVLRQGADADVGYTSGPVARAGDSTRFHDYAPIHILPTSSLARVATAAGMPGLDAVRYRPNIVLDDPPATMAETEWPGRELRIGDAVLEVTLPTPRCAVPALRHGELPRQPLAYGAVAKHNRVPVLDLGPLPSMGLYARVRRAGRIAPGDTVSLQ